MVQKMSDPSKTTIQPPMTRAMLHFICEQLREWGGIPEAEIAAIYKQEMGTMKDAETHG